MLKLQKHTFSLIENKKIRTKQLAYRQRNCTIAPDEVRRSSRKLVPLIKTKSTLVHNFLFFSH